MKETEETQMQSANKRLKKRVSFRLTEEENERLNRTAKILGCRPSDALRLHLPA